MQNFITLGQPLLGEKYVAQKKEERRKIITKIVDTSFRCNAYGQRTQSPRTKLYFVVKVAVCLRLVNSHHQPKKLRNLYRMWCFCDSSKT